MKEIDLLKYEVKIKEKEGKRYVFDAIRKKHLVLTPEELVRQKFVRYLIEEMKYPRALFRLEGGLKYGEMQKRSDILVYNQQGLPYLLIECKSYKIKLNQEVFNQASVYNRTVRARFLGITNGIEHIFYEMDYSTLNHRLLDTVPHYLIS